MNVENLRFTLSEAISDLENQLRDLNDSRYMGTICVKVLIGNELLARNLMSCELCPDGQVNKKYAFQYSESRHFIRLRVNNENNSVTSYFPVDSIQEILVYVFSKEK